MNIARIIHSEVFCQTTVLKLETVLQNSQEVANFLSRLRICVQRNNDDTALLKK